MTIRVLDPSSYRGYLEPVTEGCDGHTHIALIRSQGTAPYPAYVKLYHPTLASRGLVNEAVGYILAVGCGLTVAPHAAVLFLPKQTAQALYPSMDMSAWPYDNFPAWSIASMPGKSPKQLYNVQDASSPFYADLAGWPELPKATAFDGWTANSDRNGGNLIRLAPKSYGLIDHGRVLTGLNWMPQDLDPSRDDIDNQLLRFVESLTMADHYTTCDACDGFSDAMLAMSHDLEDWLSKLTHDDIEKTSVDQFLRLRAAIIKPWLLKKLGLLI